jgi:hypothetical protein
MTVTDCPDPVVTQKSSTVKHCPYCKIEKSAEKLACFIKSAYLCSGINAVNDMSKQEKEAKVKEFWEYYEATQGTITITDPVVLD